jgi:CAAX protease family protein
MRAPQWPLAAVLVLLVVVNAVNNRVSPGSYLANCLVGTAAVLLVARWDGCSWSDLGLGRVGLRRGLRWAAVLGGVVLLGYGAVAAPPASREAFRDDRVADLSAGAVAWKALVEVPLGTVLLEEVAFRGVLYAMLTRRYGGRVATAGSSALFGLWHVLPSLGLSRSNAAVASVAGSGGAAAAVGVVVAVSVTAVGGVVLCELRRRSGSLLAPMALHWALNGLGYGVAWAVTPRPR